MRINVVHELTAETAAEALTHYLTTGRKAPTTRAGVLTAIKESLVRYGDCGLEAGGLIETHGAEKSGQAASLMLERFLPDLL